MGITETDTTLKRGRPPVLTESEREQVAQMRQMKPPMNVAAIARALKKPWTTVRREVGRADSEIAKRRQEREEE